MAADSDLPGLSARALARVALEHRALMARAALRRGARRARAVGRITPYKFVEISSSRPACPLKCLVVSDHDQLIKRLSAALVISDARRSGDPQTRVRLDPGPVFFVEPFPGIRAVRAITDLPGMAQPDRRPRRRPARRAKLPLSLGGTIPLAIRQPRRRASRRPESAASTPILAVRRCLPRSR